MALRRWHPEQITDELARAAARELRASANFARFANPATIPGTLLKWGGRVLLPVSAVLSFLEQQNEGRSASASFAGAAIEVSAGVGTAAVASMVFCTGATAITGGLGAIPCFGLVALSGIGGSIVGEQIADRVAPALGDALDDGLEVVGDVVEHVGGVAGDVFNDATETLGSWLDGILP